MTRVVQLLYRNQVNSDIMGLQSSGSMSVMMSKSLLVLRRAAVAVALCAAMVGLAGSPAQARVFIGIGVPFYGPGFYPAPYYYPPAYYPPPPVYYAPPPPASYPPAQTYSQGSAPAGAGQACYAGSYVCPMDRPVAAGGSCYCPGNGGQKVWGRAN
jgi:hypothetical protein